MKSVRRFVSAAILSLAALLPCPMLANDGAAPAVTPDEALKMLQAGNERYVAGKSTHPHADRQRREELVANGQHPFAVILACSDSRVPVEILFDEGLGDVFVIRVAGNVCNADEAGSLEYGVDHLESPLLVVLGHTGCGAVTAVATDAELHGNLARLADGIRPALARAQHDHPDLHGQELVPSAIEANVQQAIENLLHGSSDVRHRIEAGKLKVVGAIYDLKEGKVRWLGEHPNQKHLLHAAAGGL